MSTHNIGFHEDLAKNIFRLSLNKHLISSSEKKKHTLKSMRQTYPISIKSFHNSHCIFSWVVVKYCDEIVGDLRCKDVTSDIHM